MREVPQPEGQKRKTTLQHIFLNRPIDYNPDKVTKQTLQSEMDVGEGECSPSPSLNFTKSPSPKITAGVIVIHTDGTADAVISHSLCETLPRQESCDPGKMGQRACTCCIHAGRGSPGSDTISVKCPVDQRTFGENFFN